MEGFKKSTFDEEEVQGAVDEISLSLPQCTETVSDVVSKLKPAINHVYFR